MSRIGVHFEGDAADLIQEMGKVIRKTKEHEKELAKLGRASNKLTNEQKKLAREAKRVYDETRSPQERHLQKMEQLNRLVRKGAIDQNTYRRAVGQSQQQLQQVGQAGQKAFGPAALGRLTSFVAGFLSVGAAVGAVTRGLQVWLENIREISAEAQKASGEIIAFAALQEGGKKAERVMAAAELGQRYGVRQRGVAFDTLQAMQSATGSFQQGMKLTEEVFAAKQAGMKIEDAKEIATLALGLGFDPRTTLRRAHVAGEASMRSPKELAPAGQSLKYWEDRQLGWAAAGTLAGQVSASKLETFTKHGGLGLMQIPGTARQKAFESIGLGEASQYERLKALHERGIDTIEEAMQFGITEMRQAEAVAGLVARFEKGPKGEAGVRQIYEAIGREAKPGLFQRERAAVEAELPTTKFDRQINILATKVADTRAFGPAAEWAMAEEVRTRMAALALERTGRRQLGPFDLITEEGDLTWPGRFFWGRRPIMPGGLTAQREYDAIKEELAEASADLQEAAAQLKAATASRPVQVNNN